MSLKALAETVTAHSRELDERGVVDPESLVGFRILSPDDLACRSRLLTAIEELRRLALGPAEALQEMMSVATCDITCLEALARYSIPSHVPLDGTTPIHSLASHVPHLDEATLARLLRNCIVIGAFAEPAPGRIAHTPLSRLLRDADFAGLVRFLAEEDGAAARRALDALEKWPRSRAPHHTGFHLANASSSSSAGERTESEWRELFAQADSRFVVEFEHWKSTLDGLVKATWKP